MNNIDKAYQALLQDILDNGVEKIDRTGTGTISVFGRQIRHKMSEGYPLLTTKKMAFKTMVTELLWFLRGDTNIKYLVDNNCHIWTGDAIKNYEKHSGKIHPHRPKQEYFEHLILNDDKFAKQWGDLGPIYGKQWRKWVRKTTRDEKIVEPGVYETSIDQITNLINDLKTNPDSRRLMVNAWNVGELDQMTLPPCHYGFQVYTRELSARERTALGSKGSTRLYDMIKEGDYETIDADVEMHKVCDDANVPRRTISLMWNQRSVDTFLGLPFNIASYGLLLEMIADEVNMVPDELIGNLGDVHLYKNHIEQAKEQITREPMQLPTVHVRDGIFCSSPVDVILENYQSHPAIKAPLSN
jgi:thymidylate synthase